VPAPGVCLRGIHKIKTTRLVRKVVTPMLQPLIWEKPCDKTVHGLFPAPEAINNASPMPNIVNPMHKIQSVITRGRKLKARSELHETIGTFFIENNFIVDFKFWVYSMIKQNTKKEIKRASAYSKRQSLFPPVLLRDFFNRNTSYKSPM
jgi:hypothetical protein